MAKYFFILFSALFLWGCSGTVDTANLSAEDRFKYAMELYNDESYDLAINEFQAIMLQFPGNDVVDDAQYHLGMSRVQRREYLLGANEFSQLIRNFATSRLVPDAQYQLSECYYQLSPAYSLDQRYSKKSIEEFQAFVDLFPADERVASAEKKIRELNEKLAEKEYNSAVIYEKLEFYNASLLYFSNVMEIYHDTPYAPKAAFKRINLLIQKKRTAEAETEINNFLTKYPESPDYKEVSELLAKIKNNQVSEK
ncbi:MAG: outer membrane protein assembly factor BamD [Ignavibacteriaceae bacterium]|nr:outer membrane protein assembly factor BamD [Ignavibacteriaceae bacterium]